MGIATQDEVMQATRGYEREQYAPVVVKKLDRFTVVPECAEYSACSKGDEVVAICRDGNITTVMLRKSWSKSNNY